LARRSLLYAWAAFSSLLSFAHSDLRHQIKKGEKEYPVAEANNVRPASLSLSVVSLLKFLLKQALIYPGLSLGTIVSRATRLSDKMMSEGIKALAKMAPALESGDEKDALLPGLEVSFGPPLCSQRLQLSECNSTGPQTCLSDSGSRRR
jgi:hypothetical protein